MVNTPENKPSAYERSKRIVDALDDLVGLQPGERESLLFNNSSAATSERVMDVVESRLSKIKSPEKRIDFLERLNLDVTDRLALEREQPGITKKAVREITKERQLAPKERVMNIVQEKLKAASALSWKAKANVEKNEGSERTRE